MEHDEVMRLQDVFDDRYVLKDDCVERQETVNKKFANDDKRIELLIQKWSTLEKLVGIIATATVGTLITTIVQSFVKRCGQKARNMV